MFNVRESLLFAWGIAAGVLAIGTDVAAGRPGFGIFVLSAIFVMMSILTMFGDQIARSQGRTVGRVADVRITVLYFAVSFTLLLLLFPAIP